MRRSRTLGSLVALLMACGLFVAANASEVTLAPGPQHGAPAQDGDWRLSTTTYSPTGQGGYVPTYLGNGYFSGRIPAEGNGFADTPVTTESQLAGFYGRGPGTTIQRANLPAWSTLGFSDGSGTFGNALPQGCAEGALCEAESGTLSGAARIATDHSGYTGSGFVAGFAASGNVPQRGSSDSLLLTDAHAGDGILTVRYAAGANSSTQTLTATVNGTASTVTMPATGGWNNWRTATVPITVVQGDNTLALSCGSADTCVANVDSVVVGPAHCTFGQYCEAESGTLTGDTKIATDHVGYTGTGFVAGFASNNIPNRGSSTTVNISGATAGTATLTVRYAAAVNSSTQTLTATVNDASPTAVPMPATDSWDSWQTATVPVNVANGDNSVTLSCGAADTCLVNVDSLALSDGPIQTSNGSVSDYQQTLDMRRGLITTQLTWTSPAGNRTRLIYDVFVSQARTHVAAVRLSARPLGWSGPASVLDLLDGRANKLPVSHRTPSAINLTTISDQRFDASSSRISEKASTVGLGMTAGLASTLSVEGKGVSEGDSPTARMPEVPVQSIGQEHSMNLVNGHTYTATKYIGVASGTDTTDGSVPGTVATTEPVTAAIAASSSAAATGWSQLLADHEAAWAKLWQSDVTVPGDSALTLKARASMFYLLQSARDGVDWSISPGGLSSAEYNGHVFWDAETWMYPALLAAHPDLASGMNDYRFTLLEAATATARANNLKGAQFPWESAQSGADVGIHPREIHITGDVALAQWNYYLASGDLNWLRNKGWPVFQSVADYYVSRATSDGEGGYDLKGVEGPDENHDNVNNSSYVNVAAITSLQIAQKAATLLGAPADPEWAAVAKGLAASIPFDPATNTHREYDGYSGQTINQADVVMLQYPWNFPMDRSVAQADLDYYTPRTSLSGPAMTDAINTIDTAELSTPGCSTYTYFQRSIDPYNVEPFDQFSEHLNNTGVIDFTTGIGGFLQELYYGFTGLRWDADGLLLDPMLPPQIPRLQLTGMHWQGRTFDIGIGPKQTTITLNSGAPMPVTVAGQQTVLSAHSHLKVATRRPDQTPTDDLARCGTARASSADPSYPASAAVDGANATAWKATSAGASFSVDLGSVEQMNEVGVVSATKSTSAYRIDISVDGKNWTAFGSVDASADPKTSIGSASGFVRAKYVRYTAADDVTPSLTSLSVTNTVDGTDKE